PVCPMHTIPGVLRAASHGFLPFVTDSGPDLAGFLPPFGGRSFASRAGQGAGSSSPPYPQDQKRTPGLSPGRFFLVDKASVPSAGLPAKESGDFQLILFAPAGSGPRSLQGQPARGRTPGILGYLLRRATIRRGARLALARLRRRTKLMRGGRAFRFRLVEAI